MGIMEKNTELLYCNRVYIGRMICAGSKIRGTFLAVPIIRAIVFQGLYYWVPPLFMETIILACCQGPQAKLL